MEFLKHLRLLWMLGTLTCLHSVIGTDVEINNFLEDDVGPQSVPVNLGAYPHECVGNINECPDGFTQSFWFIPPTPDPAVKELYILSSGGQSPMSDGYYFRRNYGKDFEVGVAVKDKLWSVKFYLMDGALTNVLFTWNDQLVVYVDGFEVGSSKEGVTRLHTDPQFDPFPHILVGKANDDRSTTRYPDIDIFNIVHYSKFHESQEIGSLLDQSDFYLGCSSVLPSGVTEQTDLGDQDPSTRVSSCRSHCASINKHLVFLQDDVTCTCWEEEVSTLLDYVNDLDSSQTCPDSSKWAVYWGVHTLTGLEFPIGLEVSVIKPTDYDYIRPEETVVFQFKTNTDEAVVFYVDFEDGNNKMTTDHHTSHFWSNEGQFVVNITAVTRKTSETMFVRVNITNVDEGVKPEVVDVKSSQLEESLLVDIYLAAVSETEVNCELDLGDTTVLKLDTLGDFANDITEQHTYNTAGFYDISVECTNAYGATMDNILALATNNNPDFETKPQYVDITVPLIGADTHSDSVLVYVDDVLTSVNISKSAVTIDQKVFPSGDHVIQIKAIDSTLHTRIVNIQQIIDEVKITASPRETYPDTVINLDFDIMKGTHMHVLIDYGDGKVENLYLQTGGDPLRIIRKHKYPELGKYEVSIMVANDVSYKFFKEVISIERPVMAASMKIVNTTKQGEPTLFTLKVDMEQSPAMPVDVVFDYDDGNIEKVTLGSKRSDPVPLIHKYTYQDYGIYYVTATVGNNLSAVEVSGIIQVGQNITYVDLAVDKQRVSQEQEVTIQVTSPSGSPLKFEIDTGDGNTIIVHVPNKTIAEDEMVKFESTTGNAESTTFAYFTANPAMVASNENNIMEVEIGENVERKKKKVPTATLR